MTIAEIRTHLTEGTMTARQIVDGYLERIEKDDHSIGAFVEVFAADARLAADEIDAKHARGEVLGPLAGVPVGIKDNIVIKGKEATAASGVLVGYKASYDATLIERLRAADAIILGRTNCDEFGCGSSTEMSIHGVTKNPLDQTRVAGGSSGGSAAAVAAGFVPLAFGSDTGGSVRQPASLCGIVGLKPTYGAVSRFGLMAYGSSLDTIGTFAQSASDVAEAMRVIAGLDERDLTSGVIDASFPEFGTDVGGLRIGVPKQFFDENLDPALESTVRKAIDRFVGAGAEVVELDLPLLEYVLPMYYVTATAELSSNLNRYDGLQYGAQTPGDTIPEQVSRTRDRGFGAEVKRRILLGTYVLSAGYVDAYYKKAISAREALKRSLDDAFGNVDVIMGPTSPVTAWPVGQRLDDPVAMYLADIYTVAANLAGIPGLSVPCGDVDGLPVGLQLLGARGEDARLLDLAHWFETQA